MNAFLLSSSINKSVPGAVVKGVRRTEKVTGFTVMPISHIKKEHHCVYIGKEEHEINPLEEIKRKEIT